MSFKLRVISALIFLVLYSCQTKGECDGDTLKKKMIQIDLELRKSNSRYWENISKTTESVDIDRIKWFLNNHPELQCYFDDKGVTDGNLIGKVLFWELVNYFNNSKNPLKSIETANLEEDISSLLKKFSCEQERRDFALNKLSALHVGESVDIKMPARELRGMRNAYNVMCPNDDWQYDEKNGLQINAKVIDKIVQNDSSEILIHLVIQKMSPSQASILGVQVHVKDTILFDMTNSSVIKESR